MSEMTSAQIRAGLRFLLIIHVVFTVVGAWLANSAAGHAFAVCFAFGGAVMFFNLAAHVFVWPRLLQKKLVALSISVIVFKFAILGWIIYEAATGNWIAHQLGLNADTFSLVGFAGGLSLIVPSVFATALKVALTTGESDPTSKPANEVVS